MISSLPNVRGKYLYNAELANYVWFAVGGVADVVFKPKDLDDLIFFLKNKPANIEILPLGVGSNLLVRDGGYQGVVVRLGRGFTNIDIHKDNVIVGAGALDRNVALASANEGLRGLEFLATIPGTIGGALKMNAGCYGAEVKDKLVWAKAVTLGGELKQYSVDDLNYTYRHCGLLEPIIFVEACFKADCVDEPSRVHATIQELLAKREASQPTGEKTGGSTFKNPDSQYKAWELVDKVGGRGLTLGGAQFSEKHCNFLINTGGATAADLEALGELVRDRVRKQFDVDLQWEVLRIGKKQNET